MINFFSPSSLEINIFGIFLFFYGLFCITARFTIHIYNILYSAYTFFMLHYFNKTFIPTHPQNKRFGRRGRTDPAPTKVENTLKTEERKKAIRSEVPNRFDYIYMCETCENVNRESDPCLCSQLSSVSIFPQVQLLREDSMTGAFLSCFQFFFFLNSWLGS